MDDIIEFKIGAKVAARSGNRSWYGRITAIGEKGGVVTVDFGDGDVRKFSTRKGRYQVGSKETKYTRPYLTTVANARARDAEYAAATRRAATNLASWGVVV
jgi:hypothetical protein